MRKVLSLFVCSILCVVHLYGQDVSLLVKEINRLEFVPDERAAFIKCKELLVLQPKNIFALNKASELCSRIGKRQPTTGASDSYYAAAKTYAGKALAINPNNSESNCVMAIAMGRSAGNKSSKEKIANAKVVKGYVDMAIKNDPMNFKAWHVLGRWNYELSILNGFEKTAVKLFYGGLPPASLKQSIAAFERVNKIADGFILNYFEMAKAYEQNDQKDKAIATLKRMLTLPNQTEDDPSIKLSGIALLKEWKSF